MAHLRVVICHRTTFRDIFRDAYSMEREQVSCTCGRTDDGQYEKRDINKKKEGLPPLLFDSEHCILREYLLQYARESYRCGGKFRDISRCERGGKEEKERGKGGKKGAEGTERISGHNGHDITIGITRAEK